MCFLSLGVCCRHRHSYQMVIMFLLGAASTAGAVASTSAAVYHVLDGCHRLRLERLLPRAKHSGVNGLLTEAALQVACRMQQRACTTSRRLCA